jgi:hypothetical protein
MAGYDDKVTGTGSSGMSGGARDWTTERSWWQENFRSRPYATADRGFDFYEPAYRYGHESANRYRGRSWSDAENDLRRDWDKYEYRGAGRSTWEEIKDSVRDAWNRVTGDDDSEFVRGRR